MFSVLPDLDVTKDEKSSCTIENLSSSAFGSARVRLDMEYLKSYEEKE